MDSTILTVVNKIADLISAGYQRLSDVDNQVRDLSSKLEFLMVRIKAAEERNIIVHQELVSVWVKKIREPVFDAEDIIEEYCHEILTSSSLPQREKGWPWIPCFPFAVEEAWPWIPCFPFAEAPLRYRLAEKIQGVLRDLDVIEKNYLVDVPSWSTQDETIRDRVTHSESAHIWTGDIVVGDSKDLVTKSLLMDNGNGEHIVLITGESGIGKTTVARQVYKARAVQTHFDICAWVCLPPESPTEWYLGEIHWQVEEQTETQDVIQMRDTMKYLVVLDGMDRMNDLRSVLRELPRGAKGSRILVTTKLDIGHEIPDIKDVVNMPRLELSDCLELFWKLVGTVDTDVSYRKYDDKIYSFSQGIPLAIRLLSGLLYHKAGIL